MPRVAWVTVMVVAIMTLQLIAGTPAQAHSDTKNGKARDKVIYVSLSQQRVWAYEGAKLIYKFVVSTGIPTRATKPGTFRIKTKQREAWSNVWQLRMPYWMGIYDVGSVENGFHALPINKRGGKLWAGLLGRPVSFGCIVLDDPDAAALYEWADMGTLVIVR